MSAHHHPVLMWRDADGAITAALVDDTEHAAAYARTEAGALQQLKELLEWRQADWLWVEAPDFAEPALAEVKVEIRPQYRQGERMLPCPETVCLRVPCVTGRRASGLRVASVPHLELSFEFHDSAELKSLVAHYVQESLHGLTPLQLAGRLPPSGAWLTELILRHRPRGDGQVPAEQREDLKPLFAVADPLLRESDGQRTSSAAFGREAQVLMLAQKLAASRVNLLLVGPPGVGKSTLLFNAVRAWLRLESKPGSQTGAGAAAAEEAEDKLLRRYRFWRGNASRMIAGMRYLGEWEERCETFVSRLAAIAGTFCAENLLELVRVGGDGPGESVGAFLLPYLQRGELRLIAEATPEEVEACRRLVPGLVDCLQVVLVPEFAAREAVAALERLANARAATVKAVCDPALPTLVHRLFQRFQPYSVTPGAAARFVRDLFVDLRPGTTVSSADALAAFIRLTGLPEVFVRDDLPLEFSAVQEAFAARVIGQPAAVAAAANVVVTLKAGLGDPLRPLGVLLFCGPTGVGKTELARTLASYCFGAAGARDRLMRLDMSEYAGWDAARRLLEDPQGGPAAWIERVRQQPFCVVLFDEIEKAAPEVFDVLLGLLDEGRLTDRFGRLTQFRSAIIVMTSNLGAQAARALGFGASDMPDYEAEVAKHFRPEFFNRLDAVVTFHPLTAADVAAIARKELAELAAREGFTAAGLRLEWTEEVVAAVAEAGCDPRYGARPLQRAVEQMVATPLARWRIAHPTLRDVTVRVALGVDRTLTLEVCPPGR